MVTTETSAQQPTHVGRAMYVVDVFGKSETLHESKYFMRVFIIAESLYAILILTRCTAYRTSPFRVRTYVDCALNY